jgi:glycosyltransferase involved in cell wall biosynthesis
MISAGKEHEFFVVLSDVLPDALSEVRRLFSGLLPVEKVLLFETPPAPRWFDDQQLGDSRELIREYFFTNLMVDWVHVFSPFEDHNNQAVFSVSVFADIPTSATVYDFIPFHNPQLYLQDVAAKDIYLRHYKFLQKADLLLAISEYTKLDAIEWMHLPSHRVVNVSADAAPCFRILQANELEAGSLPARYGITREFVLYTAGAEPRKNMEGLIKAFSNLPAPLKASHQLVICCDLGREKPRLEKLVSRVGLDPSDVVLTGYVGDKELIRLYNLCKLFVFPSFSEGFGLPILEAMRCGAPVIGSNTTSIPEVIGLEEALFDPTSSASVCDKIYRALTDDDFLHQLRENSARQADKFCWQASARRALDAMETVHAHKKSPPAIELQSTTLIKKPRLAYLSPLPPEKSGIADYSAEMLPGLAHFYDIDLVTDLGTLPDSWLNANFRRISIRDFGKKAAEYDRILYQFGNSKFHSHMFPLLKEFPGTVVLHDLFLSNILNYIEITTPGSAAFRYALYESHGYPALRQYRALGSTEAVWQYPCSFGVLKYAQGVIVHSDHSRRLIGDYYSFSGERYLKQIPLSKSIPNNRDRNAARRGLGLDESAFIVCSFGIMAPTKMNSELMDAWLTTSLAREEGCLLIFVGGDENEYERNLKERITAIGLNGRIKVTGYVGAQAYQDFLAASDMAVQLRCHSRGESPKTVLDCMSYGVPTITNDHGAIAELPAEALLKLSDQFSADELACAIEQLRADPCRRREMGRLAREFVQNNLAPALIARRYCQAIESFALDNPVAIQRRLISAITAPQAGPKPGDAQIAKISQAIAENTGRVGIKQLLLDISELIKEDVRTGVQRVTRSILSQLLENAPPGYRVEPVYRSSGLYRYARKYAGNLLVVGGFGFDDEPVDVADGDIFLGLDLDVSIDILASRWLLHQKRRGMKVYFVIYDLLPLVLPGCYGPQRSNFFKTWFETIATVANGFVCISRATASAVSAWLEYHPVPRPDALPIGFFHPGADIEASLPTTGISKANLGIVEKLKQATSVLMVGTIEPRKGYGQTLSAFEELWRSGHEHNLIIVGKKGWAPDITAQISRHAQLGKHLFCLDQASDQLMSELYRKSSVLLAASEGEGFGLPLVEAARYGLPIVARDIPVFREIAGTGAYYFSGMEPHSLAIAIEEWLELFRRGAHPRPDAIQYLTWSESAEQLKRVIFENNWLTAWEPPQPNSPCS